MVGRRTGRAWQFNPPLNGGVAVGMARCTDERVVQYGAGRISASADPCGERLDALHHPMEADRMQQVKGVLGSRQLRVDDRIQRDGAERVDEALGARAGDEAVAVAVSNEERRRVRANVRVRR